MKRSFFVLALGAALVACGSDDGNTVDGGSDAPAETGLKFGDSGATDSGDASACDPPDMLVVLDRSDSMGASAGKDADGGVLPPKWTLAKQAVDQITTAPSDTKLRYGLELLPATKGGCGTGVVAVPMGLGTGATIASTLVTTVLLSGTPIGGALAEATTTLTAAKVSGRDQYVILVTDGGETCSANGPLPIVQSLATAGVKTYIVGFGAAVDKSLLNDLACAGLTASAFSTSCKKTSGGYVSTGGTSALFYSATDGVTLQSALESITGHVCCGCVN